jgi:hypothetical protein
MKDEKLAPCPCGQIPESLCINDNGQGYKWAMTSGSCCGEWNIEFRTNYLGINSKECMDLAISAWNNAPRHHAT